jgi:hypothetical protein
MRAVENFFKFPLEYVGVCCSFYFYRQLVPGARSSDEEDTLTKFESCSLDNKTCFKVSQSALLYLNQDAGLSIMLTV